MKSIFLVVGIIIGAGSMFIINKKEKPINRQVQSTSAEEWNWPDSLDALVAAKENHKLIFENEEFRLLSVTVVPGILDPIHTHKGESIVWVTRTSPVLYNVYDLGKHKKLELVRTDTIIVKPGELDKATWEKPEPPHSVENIGKDTFHLYRIEYKTK